MTGPVLRHDVPREVVDLMGLSAGHGLDGRAGGRFLVLTHAVWSWRSVRSFAGAALALTVVLLITGRATLLHVVGEFDSRLLDVVIDARSSGAVSVARVASALADYEIIAIVGLVAVAVGRLRTGTWNLAWLVACSLGGSFVITGVVKLATDRARPIGALVETSSASFPSGHTVRAMALYGLIAWLLASYPSRAARILATLTMLAALVTAGSRVVLGAHWPTDVAAGVILGVVWLGATTRITSPHLTTQPPEAGGRT